MTKHGVLSRPVFPAHSDDQTSCLMRMGIGVSGCLPLQNARRVPFLGTKQRSEDRAGATASRSSGALSRLHAPPPFTVPRSRNCMSDLKYRFLFFFFLFCKPVWLHWTGAMCLLHPAFFVFLKLPLPAISAAFHFLKSLVQTTPSGVCQWHQASFTLTLDRV